MGKTRRKFSLEFKQQVLAKISSGQKSLSQAAREYQVKKRLHSALGYRPPAEFESLFLAGVQLNGANSPVLYL